MTGAKRRHISVSFVLSWYGCVCHVAKNHASHTPDLRVALQAAEYLHDPATLTGASGTLARAASPVSLHPGPPTGQSRPWIRDTSAAAAAAVRYCALLLYHARHDCVYTRQQIAPHYRVFRLLPQAHRCLAVLGSGSVRRQFMPVLHGVGQKFHMMDLRTERSVLQFCAVYVAVLGRRARSHSTIQNI